MISKVYDYQETNNPYAHNEEIVVEKLINNNSEIYISIFVGNDDGGCGIYLNREQAQKFAKAILSNFS